MAVLPILTYPNPSLREKTKKITVFNESLKKLAEDMLETMTKAPGVGLAAPQVGKAIKLLVYDATNIINEDGTEQYGLNFKTVVNPRIIKKEGQIVFSEGCLSVIELTAEVERCSSITVEAQDLDGNLIIIEETDRQAIILQHEIDHLNGILFIDHLGKVKRDMYIRRLKKHLLNKDNKNDK